MSRFEEILHKSRTEVIKPEEALYLFQKTEDEEKAEELLKTARFVREHSRGNIFRWSAGIARVLRCNLRPLCLYCPYWRENGLKPLSIEEILKGTAYIKQHGIREFHLSGGTTLGSEGRDVLHIVQAIRDAGFDDLAIQVNCGAAMSLETLKELKKLGVFLVSSVFETVNPDVFRRTKPGDDLEAKKRFANRIGEAGLELHTGIMAGLSPEETKYQDYVDFIFQIRQYEHLRRVYVTKFMPFKGIPMEGFPACSAWEAARLIAVMRLVLRDIDISSAAGWSPHDYPTPLMAGTGNKVGGVHINRTPNWKKGAPEDGFQYQGDMEFRNTMDVLKKQYQELGFTIVP
ncbi:Aldolase-type TIM barrel [Acididesulfobacillus acetoxydans]|uniref:Aldolase-type TIM barrel n=1 Tax=Acididesulfobacillus acetoxydans TaxID=1561005 RepID=A0A8S0WIE4_9FIRM|nr:radical SAM protein [Acididesulfobacillus acetoxydans]CAA7603282.1 Aldolase-type TIM barrel [Acididesulfobacillus acetoxydans]